MVSEAERLSFALRFVHAAEQIVAKTKDEEALRYWNYLQEHAFIAAPQYATGDVVTMNVLRILDKDRFSQTPEKRAPIIPFYPEDARLTQNTQSLWETSASALHTNDNNVIWLRSDSGENDFAKGCSLLHEAGHAWNAVQEGRLGTVTTDRITWAELLEEGAMHYMTARLWKRCGGNAYLQILDQATREIIRQANGKPGLYHFPWRDTWGEVLEGILGIARSPKAMNNRKWTFTCHASFEMIDRTQVNDKESSYARVIESLYKLTNHRM